MLPLIGIAIVLLGFACRVNPLLIVATAAIATGLAAGHALLQVVEDRGNAFINSRLVAVVTAALGLTSPAAQRHSRCYLPTS